MKAYIVNGAPYSGKTTFELLCKEELGAERCKIYSTIDRVKEIATLCEWNGEKNNKSRKFLSDLKDLLTEYNNLPFRYILTQVNQDIVNAPDCIFFIDCREPDEIDKLKDALNAKTILITRKDVENTDWDNHADSEVFNYAYDYVIENDGPLSLLKETINTLSFEEGWIQF